MKEIIKAGDKYNKLTAIRFDHKKENRQYWLFKCDCGNEKVIYVNHIKNGHTKSCGCLQRERHTTHNRCYSSTYRSWASMKDRTTNPKNDRYNSYGGRGITICKRWLKFENFYKDMGKRPKGMTLDRIDNDKGYYKENCRWATRSEQQNNRRTNHLIVYNGKEKTVAQWAKEMNIKFCVLLTRIKRGWSIERALTKATQKKEVKNERERR
ncbi:MAG: hypothetical protein DRG27_06945 [Deltaproteobacteria bacterium]|nr:MAG: hypothetical protein DRG27_06945 [Deltaproteobacteria bacterium]